MTARTLLSLAGAAVLLLEPLQEARAQDALTLAHLEARAMQRDPRLRELALLAAQAGLRRANIDAERDFLDVRAVADACEAAGVPVERW